MPIHKFPDYPLPDEALAHLPPRSGRVDLRVALCVAEILQWWTRGGTKGKLVQVIKQAFRELFPDANPPGIQWEATMEALTLLGVAAYATYPTGWHHVSPLVEQSGHTFGPRRRERAKVNHQKLYQSCPGGAQIREYFQHHLAPSGWSAEVAA